MIAIVQVFFIASCSYSPLVELPSDVPTDLSFAKHIEPIFKDAGCTSCHLSQVPDLTMGNAYNSLTSTNKYVNLDDPITSLIYTKAHPDVSHPKVYTSQQASWVLAWIENGAKNN